MEQGKELRFVHRREESMTRQPEYASLTDILGESPEGWSDTARQDVFSVLDAINIRYTFDACGYRFRDTKGHFVSTENVKALAENYALKKDQQDHLRRVLHGFRDEMRAKQEAERVRTATHGLAEVLRGSPLGAAYRHPSRIPDYHGSSAPSAHVHPLPPVLLEPAMVMSYDDHGDRVYLLKDRIPPVCGFTPQETAFFQEGDDMSYVHDLLSGRTTLPARAQVVAMPVSAKPVGERPRFSFGRRFAQAASVLVAGAALVASYVSHSYARHQEQAALADPAAYETRAQAPVYTIEK